MFLYVKNKFNPNPEHTLRPIVPANQQQHLIEYISAPIYVFPKTLELLRQSKPAKSWAKLRTRKSGLTTQFGEIEFEFLENPNDIEPWLPHVHDLFMGRWAGEHSNSAWLTKSGFAEYGQAMLELAATGDASLGVLYVKNSQELLAYSYNLHDGKKLYFYQHTASVNPDYRKYGLGKLFISDLIHHCVAQGRFSALDFMLGEQEYKMEWADSVQKVYAIIDRNTYTNFVLYSLAIVKARFKIRILRMPTVKRWIKKILR